MDPWRQCLLVSPPIVVNRSDRRHDPDRFNGIDLECYRFEMY